MLEICFSQSQKSALRAAQRDRTGKKASPVFVFSGEEGDIPPEKLEEARLAYEDKQEKLSKVAVPLGGKAEDIVCLSPCLSEGDIAAPMSTEDSWAFSMADLTKLISSADSLRIWLDDSPDAQCGLLFLANLLKGKNPEIQVLSLDKRIFIDGIDMRQYRTWGDVPAELFGLYAEGAKKLSEEEMLSCAKKWQELKAENAPLRVVENGEVKSAELTYYDDRIRKEFPEGRCKIATIIGNSLLRQKILTGDVFVAKRVEMFIENGELSIVSGEYESFYDTLVEKG